MLSSRGGAGLSFALHPPRRCIQYRLIALDETGATFRVKDCRRNGSERHRTMTLEPGEFIRRFLLHVLSKGFYSIRHYGLLSSAGHKANIARDRDFLGT